MLKLFYLLSSLLLLMTISIGMHYALGDRQAITDRVNEVARMTRMTSPSLSVAYYERRIESRVQGIDDTTNLAYPEMMPVERMDFVSEK